MVIRYLKFRPVRRTVVESIRCSETAFRLFSTRTGPSLLISDRVGEALEASRNDPNKGSSNIIGRGPRAVVGLESTIVAHGMPYPENWELSLRLNTILRERGVEPAVIAICNGVCRVGLTDDELHDLAVASKQGRRVEKCSTREISMFLARHWQNCHDTTHDPSLDPTTENDSSRIRNSDEIPSSNGLIWGATTVASTIALAHRTGISTVVTGGMGGVHRDVDVSMDVSADLMQLAQTPVVVVSAGIKSILDISKTLQVLETFGVPTVAYRTNEFPAFFSPHSGVPAPFRMDHPETIANAYWAARNLDFPHGMLVAVPNESPADGQAVEDAIHKASREADELGIRGRDVTPFLLKRVAEQTHGESLRSNIRLVEQNARVGADIAIAIARQKHRNPMLSPDLHINAVFQKSSPKDISSSTSSSLYSVSPSSREGLVDQSALTKSRVVVMGGIVLDTATKPKQKLVLKTSNPATKTESDGGVGRNIAEVLGRLGCHPLFYSAVGDDGCGRAMLERLRTECGVQVTIEGTVAVMDKLSTPSYAAILDEDGDMHVACFTGDEVLRHICLPNADVLKGAEFLVVDANAPVSSIATVVERAHSLGVKVFLEPTSVPKAKLIGQDKHHNIFPFLTFASPNLDELWALVDGSNTPTFLANMMNPAAIQDLCRQLLKQMNPQEAHLLVTMGANGVFYASRKPKRKVPVLEKEARLDKNENDDEIDFQHFAVDERDRDVVVANATGAGDTLVGVFLHALLQGKSLESAIRAGMRGAVHSLSCRDRAVSPSISSLYPIPPENRKESN